MQFYFKTGSKYIPKWLEWKQCLPEMSRKY